MSAGALAALTGIGGLSPRRLRLLLTHHTADDALQRLADGSSLHPMCLRGLPADTVERLRSNAAAASPGEAAARCAALGVEVLALGDGRYPASLARDPEAPVVVFVLGDPSLLDRRRVGIVGTRHATASGRATAADLGAALSEAGVAVVSGLARGIDAAAHRGVRDADGPGRAAAIVGSGLDVPYPKQNAEMWAWVASEGLLVSEWPPGTPPDGWRFPQRNRIIAALSEVLVVVESRERGGSLITARLALERGVDVMAVPGSPRNRASSGANQLIRDGAAPVLTIDDVLDALSLDHRRDARVAGDSRPALTALEQLVVDVCDDRPANLEMIVTGTGLPVTEAALLVARLERSGWLIEAGGWFEPLGSRLCRP